MKTAELFPAEFIKKLENLAFIVRKIRRGRSRGEHLTYRRGASLEFYDYRGYQAGDDLRYIDWNIYERLGRLVTKVFSAEEDLTVHFLLDASASMSYGNPSKSLYAARLCAALSYIGLINLDRIGITCFRDAPIDTLPPVRRRDMFPIFSFLSRVHCRGETGFNASLREFSRMSEVPGLAVVITDMLDPAGYREGLLSLLYRRWDVVLLHLQDKSEYAPYWKGDLRLEDSETGGRLDLVIDRQMRDLYRRKAGEFVGEIERFCMDKRIEYYPVRTDLPFENVVLTYLRKGMHLH